MHFGDATLNPWRYFGMFLVLIGPWLLMLVVLTPGDTWREFRCCFDPRIIRRGMRFPRFWKWRPSRIRFSIRSLLILTTLLAFQQGFLFQFRGHQWWAMFVLTTFAAIVFVSTAILTSCNIPRRRYRDSYQRSSVSGAARKLPEIDVRGTPKPQYRSMNSGTF